MYAAKITEQPSILITCQLSTEVFKLTVVRDELSVFTNVGIIVPITVLTFVDDNSTPHIVKIVVDKFTISYIIIFVIIEKLVSTSGPCLGPSFLVSLNDVVIALGWKAHDGLVGIALEPTSYNVPGWAASTQI